MSQSKWELQRCIYATATQHHQIDATDNATLCQPPMPKHSMIQSNITSKPNNDDTPTPVSTSGAPQPHDALLFTVAMLAGFRQLLYAPTHMPGGNKQLIR